MASGPINGPALEFLMCCALVSRVPDVALLMLMADPRLVQRRDAIAAGVEAFRPPFKPFHFLLKAGLEDHRSLT